MIADALREAEQHRVAQHAAACKRLARQKAHPDYERAFTKAKEAGASEVWWIGGEGNRFGYWHCKTPEGIWQFTLPTALISPTISR